MNIFLNRNGIARGDVICLTMIHHVVYVKVRIILFYNHNLKYLKFNSIKGYGGIPTGDRNDQIQLSTCTPVATADEIDPETLIPPQWGTTWTLPEAHEILIGPKNDPFCFVVFPGADSVSEII